MPRTGFIFKIRGKVVDLAARQKRTKEMTAQEREAFLRALAGEPPRPEPRKRGR